MLTVNMHDAKTNLSRLIQRAVQGEAFLIAKAGEPLVKVTSIAASHSPSSGRVGFMADRIEVPDDFDQMGAAEVEELFSQ